MANVSDQVGRRIREFRHQAGLSQEALAFNSGIHVSFLSEIERGLKKPSIESLEKLLSALDIGFQEFFDIGVRTLKDRTALEKLILELRGRSDQEVELIHNIAKHILAYEDRK